MADFSLTSVFVVPKDVTIASTGSTQDLTAGKGLFSEPVDHVIKTSEDYKKSKGITVDAGERITDIDVENSKKIADAYDEMESNPNDPEVKAAYNAMANETMDQFKYLIDNGYTVEMKIPFSEIPFPNGTDQEWHINFYRRYFENGNEIEVSSQPRDRNNNCVVCQTTDNLVLKNIVIDKYVNDR